MSAGSALVPGQSPGPRDGHSRDLLRMRAQGAAGMMNQPLRIRALCAEETRIPGTGPGMTVRLSSRTERSADPGSQDKSSACFPPPCGEGQGGGVGATPS